MAPAAQPSLLSPAELSYLHTSLSLSPPIRPDGRTPTQYRPLRAETNFLPGANGNARVCLADGGEAIVGIKAEVEKSEDGQRQWAEGGEEGGAVRTDGGWVEISVEIPGYRDDDGLGVFLGSVLREALILLLSPPTTYPLPLLSLTTHLALLSTRLPALTSDSSANEDPFFNDDWDASTWLYPRSNPTTPSILTKSDPEAPQQHHHPISLRPPITILTALIASNILFDPSREEIAVADTLLAISIAASTTPSPPSNPSPSSSSSFSTKPTLHLLSIRTIDPPSRLTPLGVPDSANSAIPHPSSTFAASSGDRSGEEVHGVWTPRRGGMPRALLKRVLEMVLGRGGVGEEVVAGLEGVDVG
ncbi:hypothetical protein MMC20_004098 [Loxospora ochrophaea]|nr:hypothetical protein [Loxospora ochrophaea]